MKGLDLTPDTKNMQILMRMPTSRSDIQARNLTAVWLIVALVASGITLSVAQAQTEMVRAGPISLNR